MALAKLLQFDPIHYKFAIMIKTPKNIDEG